MIHSVFSYHSRIQGILTGTGVLLLAVLLSTFAVIPAYILDPAILQDLHDVDRAALTVYMIFNFIGFVVAGVLYIHITGRGWDFIDISVPSTRDLKWMIGGIVLLLGYYILVSIAAAVIGVTGADSEVVLMMGDDITMILIMIAIVLVFNAPAEEFLFRNIIQKRLYDSFSGGVAIIIASLIFVLPHLPSYLSPEAELTATAVSLIVLLGGSIIMGYAYLRTENLVVPIVIHAGMNVFVLGLYLLSVLYEIEDQGMAASVLLGLG